MRGFRQGHPGGRETVNWKGALAITLGLAFFFALPPRWNAYTVIENICLLLVVVAVLTVALFFVIALACWQQAARIGLSWLKARFVQHGKTQ